MKNQNTKTPSTHEIQILWRLAFSVPAVWFLFWVLNDLFVLHRSISEVNATNILGLLVCVALILASANFDVIGNRLNPKVQSIPQKPSQTSIIKPIEKQSDAKPKASNQGKINQRTQPSTPMQTMNQPIKLLQITKNTQGETPKQTPTKVKQPETMIETKPQASYAGKFGQNIQQTAPSQTINQPAVQLQISKNGPVETLEQMPKESQPQVQQQDPAQPGCPHFFGYLNQKDSTKEILVGCLSCKNLIGCMSKREQTQ